MTDLDSSQEQFVLTMDTRANEIVSQVIDEHALTLAEVADGTGISAAHVSRILSGQYAVTASVFRYLWRRTADRRVVRAALGTDDLVESIPRADRIDRLSTPDLVQRYGFAVGTLNQIIFRPGSIEAATPDQRRQVADALLVVAALLRRAHSPQHQAHAGIDAAA